jgi:UvrD-like helicase C-terminal domain/AAA domain
MLAALDLQRDPSGYGKRMHRIDNAPGFWSARANRDIRLVIGKEGDNMVLAWAGHHDDAYRWAEGRRLTQHERTGAMQFVEIISVEAVVEAPATIVTPVAPPSPISVKRPFEMLTDDQLLDVGVPRDWLQPVRETSEAEVSALLERLPAEASEALMDFVTGGSLEDHIAVKLPEADPFAHPDAQRRFRTVDNIEELRAALDQPFAKWAVFLHPAQRALVERDWTGPARVSGTAGTGKTIVALHRAVQLARDSDARVLLTTFSKPLAQALISKRDILTESDSGARSRVSVAALDQAAYGLYEARFGKPTMANDAPIRAAITAAREVGLGAAHSVEFLIEEWNELVDAWNVTDADSYASIPRLGRRTRLGPVQREAAWGVFAFVRSRLADRKLTTWPELYAKLTASLAVGGTLPYSHVIVDEAQDLSVAQVRFLAEIAKRRPDALFLAGDLGQRIFHLPFSWSRLGLDIRGRSHCLKVNYRTSHQIRAAADRLLPAVIADMDGVEEGRRGTVSVFDGPVPEVSLFKSQEEEQSAVTKFIQSVLAQGVSPSEIGVLVRGQGQLGRARKAIAAAGLDARSDDGVAILKMHDAKGLEFRAIAVIACDDDVLPDPARLAAIGDAAELEAAYETERHLLYVACTRARDRLLVTGVSPGSEFLDDLAEGSKI